MTNFSAVQKYRDFNYGILGVWGRQTNLKNTIQYKWDGEAFIREVAVSVHPISFSLNSAWEVALKKFKLTFRCN